MNIPEIENLLRLAPRLTPPAGLKGQLIAQVQLPASQTPADSLATAGWLRRWWPVLAPATVSLACAVGLTVQQMEIRDLKQTIQGLSQDSAAKAAALATPAVQTNDTASATDAEARTQQEIARLKALASQLTAEVNQLEQMRMENAKLRTQLAAPPAGSLTPEEADALAKAQERADRIRCVNNMKQLGLAARLWANDNDDVTPPDILSMTNEMPTPKILVCPGDKVREAAKDWASYTSANCSYEYLAPSAPETEPTRVMFRCPIHGNVGLVDGSVQGGIAKSHPERIVEYDGKLYFPELPARDQGVSAPPSGNPPPGGSNP
jgi:regulator of replication initiation timing